MERALVPAASDAATNAGESAGAKSADQSPDSLAGVQQRVAAMPPIVLGKDMADNLGATVGSVVLVVSPQGELTPFGMVPKYNRFRVVGIFNSGFFDYDSSLGLRPPVRRAEAIRPRRPDLRHRIQSRRHRPGRRNRSQLEDAAGKGFMATNWQEQNKALFHALKHGAPRHLHHHRPHRLRRRPQHSDLSDHDGHGKDQRHRRPHVDGHAPLAGAQPLHRAGRADRRDRHRHRPASSATPSPTPEATITCISLSPEVYSIDYVPFAPRAIDGVLVALFARANFVCSHALPVVVCSPHSPGRGPAL